jgi:hypothetical protein
LQHNRLTFGQYRYGPISVGRFASIDSAIDRLVKYKSDANLEHLVDAANLCHVEFAKSMIGLGLHARPMFDVLDDARRLGVKWRE